MTVAGSVLVLLQVLFTVCAVMLGVWFAVPWAGLLTLALLGGIPVAARVAPARIWERLWKRFITVSWVCTFGIPASFSMARSFTLDICYGVVAWLLAASIFVGSVSHNHEPTRRQFRILGMAWAFLGSLAWLAGAYAQNLKGPFYIGLLLLLALLVVCLVCFKLPSVGIQAVNTLILILVGLPVADIFYRPSESLVLRSDSGHRYYSYDEGKRDPAAFGRWWRYYLDQWDLMGKDVFAPDPAGALPFRLRPNGRGFLCQSQISINSLGYRGKEFAREKGNAYRVVALGESTTFGCTLRPEDRPWPEVLEQIIRERIPTRRPVEVINAGIPAFTLKDNLRRLVIDILPLKPDLIISYHGANGFRMLDSALPTLSGRVAPVYRERPLKLLADCEYRIKVVYYRHRQTLGVTLRPPSFSDLMNSKYAGAYRELITITETNGIRLALANFSMAVSTNSEPGPVEFYGTMFPGVEWSIRANAAHSRILEELAREHPRCLLVDTHPNLDGVHERFIDLLHLTQEGRQQLAENMFAGIREVLEADLCKDVHGAN